MIVVITCPEIGSSSVLDNIHDACYPKNLKKRFLISYQLEPRTADLSAEMIVMRVV